MISEGQNCLYGTRMSEVEDLLKEQMLLIKISLNKPTV